MTVEKVVAHICKLKRAEKPIEEPILKMGGKPVFYEEVEWPVCTYCGQRMDFLGQVPLQNPQRFTDDFNMAYAFMCPGKYDEREGLMCDTFSPFSGANAVILQKKTDQTYIPDVEATYPDYDITVAPELEPDIDIDDESVDEDEIESVSGETKIGGTPMWLQTNETPVCMNCLEMMTFVFQINPALDGPYPAKPTKEEWDTMQFLKFGMGYVFICSEGCREGGAAFLWQCD